MTATYPLSRPSAFAANATNPLATLDSDLVNLTDTLNGLGNGVSVIATATITTASITNANITNGFIANASIASMSANTAVFVSPLGIGSGGTNASTFGNNAVVVITAGSMTGVLPAANGTVLTSNGTAWGPATQAAALAANPVSNSLSANITFNTSFTDGPSINVGNVGTWFVSGGLTYQLATAGTADFIIWDGVTLIQSGSNAPQGVGASAQSSLSGIITNPQGNLKLSILVNTSVGTLRSKTFGGSNLATYIAAYRIA